jgi:hypothetical protein
MQNIKTNVTKEFSNNALSLAKSKKQQNKIVFQGQINILKG